VAPLSPFPGANDPPEALHAHPRTGDAVNEGTITLMKADVSERRPARIQITPEFAIAVFQSGGAYFAIDDRCPHQGVSFAGGAFNGSIVICPGHGFRIDVRTGRCPLSTFLRVDTFRVSAVGERLDVELGDRAPPSCTLDPSA
jgi:3-phenylpropionate/trans-cinnamate dioxygenase ferredoxin subunit